MGPPAGPGVSAPAALAGPIDEELVAASLASRGWPPVPDVPSDLHDAVLSAETALARYWRDARDRRLLDIAVKTWERVVHSASARRASRAFRLAAWNRLSIAYTSRSYAHASVDDLTGSITAVRKAIRLAPVDELQKFWTNLAANHVARYEVTGASRDLTEAVRAGRIGRDHARSQGDRRHEALALSTLAISELARFRRTGSKATLDQAIDLARQSVEVAPDDDARLRIYAVRLSNMLEARWGFQHRPEDLDEAIRVSEAVVAVGSINAIERAANCTSLGNVYAARADALGSAGGADAEAAWRQRQEAVDLTDPASSLMSARQNNLGISLRGAFTRTGEPACLRAAVLAFRRSLRATPRDAPGYPDRLRNVALAIIDLGTVANGDVQRERARRLLWRAVDRGQVVNPMAALNASLDLVRLAATEPVDWKWAADAYRQALIAAEQLYRRQVLPRHKRGWAETLRSLPSEMCYALCRAGRAEEAVEALERSRIVTGVGQSARDNALLARLSRSPNASVYNEYTECIGEIRRLESMDNDPGRATLTGRELSERLAAAGHRLNAIVASIRRLPTFGGLLRRPTFADIRRRARSGSLVYLASATEGGVAIVVQAGRPPELVWLPRMTSEVVMELVMRADQGATGERGVWMNALTFVGESLWDLGIREVAASLSGRRWVTLVPVGALCLLPLHAAGPRSDGQDAKRTFLIDRVRLGYAIGASRAPATAKLATRHLLAIDDPRPQPSGTPPLRFSADEVAGIARWFPSPSILSDRHARLEPVLRGMAGASISHFSCHGMSDPIRPLSSQLALSHGDRLTVTEILAGDFDGRVMVLSACESALASGRVPDEGLTLAGAFVQAGAHGVIGSLWKVPEVSTAVLMIRLYDEWIRRGRHPARALVAAQRWVRNTTNGQKVRYLRRASTTAGSLDLVIATLEALPRDAFGHNHPYHWAAFTYTGEPPRGFHRPSASAS